MAGSRLERVGTIFSRLTGLLRAGAIKDDDKPIWYEVYKAFPPLHEPKYFRVRELKEIKPIFYPEDIIRAKFYKKFGSPDLINLTDKSSLQLSERYVQKYKELEKSGNVVDLESATEDVLAAEGIILDRNKARLKENKMKTKQTNSIAKSLQSIIAKEFKVKSDMDEKSDSISDKT